MSFAENLKQVRKEKGLSQEELAELMDVSRQAVSKWEQGQGYPEVEKLLLLSRELNVSLDYLMSAEIISGNEGKTTKISGKIMISSPKEHVVTTCYKVMSSGKMKGGKHSPKYALYGVSEGPASFWGEPTTFLGWYTDEELLGKEVEEIRQAITRGDLVYELKYNAKVERKWLSIKIVEENI
ncbi:MAG: helix-turn-helix transcriptional regulator [Oscillospiraceae bacterium]|nr:helix-turn-helix transcriptional regulator [Oscillospiraceae bacterium]